MSTTTTPESSELVEAVTSFTMGTDVVRVGTRFDRNHDLVRRFPAYFISATAPDNEKGKAQHEALYGPSIEQAAKQAADNPPPPPPVLRVVAWEAVAGPYSIGDRRHPRILWPGDRLAPDAEAVRRWPYLFRAITQPER